MANSMCDCCSDAKSYSQWVGRLPHREEEDDYLKEKNKKLEEEITKLKKEKRNLKEIVNKMNIVNPTKISNKFSIKGKCFFKESCSELRDITLLYYMVTDRCNFNCSYCFQKDVNPIKREEIDINKRILNTINSINEIRKNNRKCGIMLAGGEPTLDIDFIKLLYKTINPLNIVDFWAISTNGLLLKKSEDILKICNVILINKCHYKNDIQKKYCGTFYDMKKDKNFIKKYNKKIVMMCIILEDMNNIKEIKEYINYFYNNFKIRRFCFMQNSRLFFSKSKEIDYFYDVFTQIENDDEFTSISIRKTNKCFCRKYKYKDTIVEIQGYLNPVKEIIKVNGICFHLMKDIYIDINGNLVINHIKI